jgi:hypothetical protein
LSALPLGTQIVEGAGSSFSEEDLTSDLIGFYIAKAVEFYGRTAEEVREDVRHICGAFNTPKFVDGVRSMDVSESLNVWKKT